MSSHGDITSRLADASLDGRNALLQFGEGGKCLGRRPGVCPLQQRNHEQELVLQPDDRLPIRGHRPDASVEDVLVFGITVTAQRLQRFACVRGTRVDRLPQLLQLVIRAIRRE